MPASKPAPLLVCLLALAAIAPVPEARAYRLSGDPSNLHRWFPQDLPVPFHFAADNEESDLPGEAGRDELRAAFAGWQAVEWLGLAFGEAGASSAPGFSRDGRSTLSFEDPFDDLRPYVIAATATWWTSDQTRLTRGLEFNRILESDIVFAEDRAFMAHDPDAACWGIDLRAAAAHEIGHLIGLGHSELPAATMAPTLASCDLAKALLDADDQEAARFVYPPIVAVALHELPDRAQRALAFPLTPVAEEVDGDWRHAGAAAARELPLIYYQLEPRQPSAAPAQLAAVKAGADVVLVRLDP